MDNNISLDKIILGHNQFFGTNHMSSEKGLASATYFNKIENVIELIEYAYDEGATGIMLSTHPNAINIKNAIQKNKKLNDNLNVYILLPYMAKYVRMMNEKGLINIIMDILKQANFKEKINLMSQSIFSLINKDFISILKTILDVEIMPFKDLKIKSIFLHNSLTDILVSLKLFNVLEIFDNHLKDKYKINPGYCTLNFFSLTKFLYDNNYQKPIIMAPFNPIGFQMNPSKLQNENILKESNANIIAMNTLASGFVRPEKAYQYLSKFPKIKSFIVGSSSKKHIYETFHQINKNINLN